MIHIVAAIHLGGAAVATPIVRYYPEAFRKEEGIWASQSSDDSGQPWWNTLACALFEPHSL